MATSSDAVRNEASRFSVVIPAFRAARTIEAAVASALTQTSPALEVIVVDDGCPDGTGDLVAARFPSVRVVRPSNAGEGAARNAGLAAAVGKWVAFLDADDLWLPNHLATLGRLREAFPAAHLLSTGHVQLAADGAILGKIRAGKKDQELDYLRVAARGVGLVWSSAAAVRRETALSLGGFGPWRAGADLEFWARVAMQHPIAVSRRTTALYRRGVGGVMEELARERLNAPTSPQRRVDLRGVSPSTDTVLDALERGDHTARRSSLIRYVDGRVTAGWRTAVLSGHPREALRTWRLLHQPWRPTALRWVLASFVPGQPVAWALRNLRARLRVRR
jgi:glycosyltransferase involved in cell wall biosynthesis